MYPEPEEVTHVRCHHESDRMEVLLPDRGRSRGNTRHHDDLDDAHELHPWSHREHAGVTVGRDAVVTRRQLPAMDEWLLRPEVRHARRLGGGDRRHRDGHSRRPVKGRERPAGPRTEQLTPWAALYARAAHEKDLQLSLASVIVIHNVTKDSSCGNT